MRSTTAMGIVRQSAPLLLSLVVIQLATGQLLHAETDRLIALPILLVLVPVINGVGGNVASVLGARLASGLHVGLVEPRIGSAAVRGNVLRTLLVGLLAYVILGLVLLALMRVPRLGIGGLDAWRLFFVLVAAGMALVAVLVVITVAAAMWSFRTGRDPDNTVIPIVTTVGDFTGVFALLLVVRMVSP